ncbi:hypothetical protein EDB81DRAFT_245436 [Dactylonectria macrodidyma]|uniref:GPI anchored serine-threonine rich protein n=1 Tax=Dactylonectria macrodidyma TaxID=307937 RepID=A0A9P9DDQ2_9HYPO|nr:hypothetical protein EDB81DRAFT_245436 [Dactylonectria macrodidyma]
MQLLSTLIFVGVASASVPRMAGRSSAFLALKGVIERQVDFCEPISAPYTCERSCGPGFVECIAFPTCYNPGRGDACCSDGSYCPAGSYCTDAGCCPDELSLSECGATATLSVIPPPATEEPSTSTSPPEPTTADETTSDAEPTRSEAGPTTASESSTATSTAESSTETETTTEAATTAESTTASETETETTTAETTTVAKTTTGPADSTTLTSTILSTSGRYSNASTIVTSTITATNVYTITSCAPTVTNCPYGSVTTKVVTSTTLVCPQSTATYTLHQTVKCAYGQGDCSAGSITTIDKVVTIYPLTENPVPTPVPGSPDYVPPAKNATTTYKPTYHITDKAPTYTAPSSESTETKYVTGGAGWNAPGMAAVAMGVVLAAAI